MPSARACLTTGKPDPVSGNLPLRQVYRREVSLLWTWTPIGTHALVVVAVAVAGLALVVSAQILAALLIWAWRRACRSPASIRRMTRADGVARVDSVGSAGPVSPAGDKTSVADWLAAAAWGAAVYGLAGPLLLAAATASWIGVGVVGFVLGVLGVGLVSPACRTSVRSGGARASLIAGATGGALPLVAVASGRTRLLEPLGPPVWMLFLATCVAAGTVIGAVLAACGIIAPLRLARDWAALRDGSWSGARAANLLTAGSLWSGAAFTLLAMNVAAGILWIDPGLVSQGGQARAVASGVSGVAPTPPSDIAAAEPPAADGVASPSPMSEAALGPGESATAGRLSESLGRPLSATARNEHGWTDLHYAAVLDLPELAGHLLDAGADVDARSYLQGMDPEVAPEVRRRYPPNRPGDSFLDKIASSGLTPLHLATSGDIVTVLLAGGADIHARDSFGNTPLHIAAYQNASEAAVALLRQGANVDAGKRDDRNGPTTPLHNAAHRLNREVVTVLLDHGADVNVDSGFGTPLHEVVYGSGPSVLPLVSVLLEWGADIDARGYAGRTPLHLAAFAEEASVPVVSALLDFGAAVDARDDHGNTPLHLAAANAAPAIVAVLLVHGAVADARNSEGRTPMQLSRDRDGATRALLRQRGAR